MGKRYTVLNEIAHFGKENNVPQEKLCEFAFNLMDIVCLIGIDEEHDKKYIREYIESFYSGDVFL